MITFLAGLALRMFGPKLSPVNARRIAIGSLVLAVIVAVVLLAKCAVASHDENHDLKRDRGVIENTASANTNLATEQGDATVRLAEEKRETQEAIEHAKAVGSDPRAAYYHCVQLQQRARASGDSTPDC